MATAVWTCLDLRGWQLLSWCWGRQRQEGLDGIALAWLVQAETKRKIQPSVPSMSSTLLCHLIPAKVLKILRDKDQSRGIRSSRCNVDALLPKWGDNRGPVRLVWIAFVLDAWRGHVHRCAQMCRYCKVVAGACIPWNSSYAMCLWWSSKYIWCISMQKFRGKVTFKIFQESVAKIPAWQPDRITKKSTHIHTLWLWIMSIYVIHFGMKSRTIGERRFFFWAMPEDLANTPAERAAATERVYRPIHFFYSKELRPKSSKWPTCHGKWHQYQYVLCLFMYSIFFYVIK